MLCAVGSNERSTRLLIARITPIGAIIAGPPCSATSISTCIAACHSGASCSALGRLATYSPASRSVVRLRPSGSAIGSSNGRDKETAISAFSYASFLVKPAIAFSPDIR